MAFGSQGFRYSSRLPRLSIEDGDLFRDQPPILAVFNTTIAKAQPTRHPDGKEDEFYFDLRLSDEKKAEFDADVEKMLPRITNESTKRLLSNLRDFGSSNRPNDGVDRQTLSNLEKILKEIEAAVAERTKAQVGPQAQKSSIGSLFKGGRKTSKIGRTFNRCVKSVRKTVKARKGSTKESAAIAICTTSVLQTRGRTLKRYRKGRLVTQKRRA